jgi:glycosyltransferase involved in cell wall biosynthesis
MKILICTRQVLFCVKGSNVIQQKPFFPGGIRRKIDNEVAALKKRGHSVALFDGWHVIDPDSIDIVYLIGASLFTESLCREALANHMKLVVAPVFDNTHHPLPVKLATVTAGSTRFRTNPGSIKYICGNANTVCVSSDTEMEEIHRVFRVNRDKIRIVPNYVDTDNDLLNSSRDLFVENYGIEDFLLCVGAIGDPRKNILRLVRIAGEMNIPTVIIGPDLDQKHAAICKGEARRYRNVHILGCVSDRMLWSAYAATNTLVMPSIVESTGLVALEAALMGANIVSTEVGGPSYYLGDYAEYVNPKSDSSIMRGIELAYGRGKTGDLRNHIIKEFNINTVGRVLENALVGVLD